MLGAVVITYRNWRGETADRLVLPTALVFEATEWHSEPQWILQAKDLTRNVDRSFAMADVLAWQPATIV